MKIFHSARVLGYWIASFPKKTNFSFLFLCLLCTNSFSQGLGSPCTSCLICDVGLVCDGSCTCTNILPVKLTRFEVKETENGVELTWTTTEEVNNDYFVVERSSEDMNYREITRIKGLGNSSKIQTYVFEDPNPLNGMNYYRLKQTDYNGKVSYFIARSINFHQDANQVTCSPNPFFMETVLQINHTMDNATLTICNSFGLKVKEIPNIKGQTIIFNRDNLACGCYFFFLTENNNVIASDKLFVTNVPTK